jgi:hypothetical protein
MPGHVFVVHGDIWDLSCDAVLLPTDHDFNIESKWNGHIDGGSRLEWQGGENRVSESHKLVDPAIPARFVNVGSTPGIVADQPLEWLGWLRENIATALTAIGEEAEGSRPGHSRAVPLVALPILGVGQGGGNSRRGDAIEMLLEVVEQAAKKHRVDFTIVCYRQADFAAVQHLRREMKRKDPIQQSADSQIAQLADYARKDKLVLFIGAGVSAGAGAPTWQKLIDRIVEELKVDLKHQSFSGWNELNEQDRAELLRLMAKREQRDIDEIVKVALDLPRASLIHFLLASMALSQVVTTNYDDLFEKAAAIPYGGALKVLPSASRPTPTDKWLLKMHGDINLGSIVLSRDDYLQYDNVRRPMASIVQAQLLTRHMLFVGFSMGDDNLTRLARDVGRFIEHYQDDDEDEKLIGTVLSSTPSGAKTWLWDPHLKFYSPPLSAGDDAEAEFLPAWFRATEIFLDELLLEATPSKGFLLDQRYKSLLSEKEDELAVRANELAAEIQAGNVDSDSGWSEISNLLKRLGSTDA